MSNEVLIHVGYPKTATSALQKYLFPDIDAIDYLGKFEGDENKFSISGIEEALLLASTMSEEDFSNISLQGLKLSGDKLVLISEEVLLFNIFRPTLWRSSRLGVVDVVRNLRRIESEWGVCFSILLTIRDQVDMISSIYAQCYNSCYSRMPETVTFNDFFNYFFESKEMMMALNYDYVFDEFCKVFSSVDVMVYEELKLDNVNFLRKVSAVIGTDLSRKTISMDNVRQGDGYKRIDDFTLSDFIGALRYKVKFLRHVRAPWLRTILHRVKIKDMSSVAIDVALSEQQKTIVRNYYEPSNHHLSSKLDLNLAALGYQLSHD